MKDELIKVGVLFYLTSIFGFIYEYFLNYYYTNKFFSHGYLHGPWLPIYGVGSLILSLLDKYKKFPLVIFLLSFLLTGSFEYLSGLLLLRIGKMRLWDYTGRMLNIDGLVCLLSASIFGVGGILITYVINPFIDKLIKNINKDKLVKCLSILSIIFIADLFISNCQKIKKII